MKWKSNEKLIMILATAALFGAMLLPPFSSDLPFGLTEKDLAWHFDGESNFFEWQYFWARNNEGEWLIISVGQALTGDFLTIATGDSTSEETKRYAGRLKVGEKSLLFDSISAKCSVNLKNGKYFVSLTTSDHNFSGQFVSAESPIRHGEVRVSDSITTPNYYSLPMLVTGKLYAENRIIEFSKSPGLNDHQYGLSSDLSRTNDWDLSFDHTWFYANLGTERLAGAVISEQGRYLILQSKGGRGQKLEDFDFTVLERFSNSLPKTLSIKSNEKNIDLIIKIPGRGASTGEVFLEDGSAVAEGTINGRPVKGVGIIESANKR